MRTKISCLTAASLLGGTLGYTPQHHGGENGIRGNASKWVIQGDDMLRKASCWRRPGVPCHRSVCRSLPSPTAIVITHCHHKTLLSSISHCHPQQPSSATAIVRNHYKTLPSSAMVSSRHHKTQQSSATAIIRHSHPKPSSATVTVGIARDQCQRYQLMFPYYQQTTWMAMP